jgi:hypothetical protein
MKGKYVICTSTIDNFTIGKKYLVMYFQKDGRYYIDGSYQNLDEYLLTNDKGGLNLVSVKYFDNESVIRELKINEILL